MEVFDIKYKTKADFVFDELRNRIINKEYQAGDRLVVADLARSLEVSPMPVREALIRLSQENFVSIIPHVGASVINFDKRRMVEIQQIRTELEVLATRLLAPVITDAQCKKLDALLADGASSLMEEDKFQYYSWNKAFHLAIAEMNPNRTLEGEIKTAWERMNIISQDYHADDSGWRKESSYAEHQLWVSALKTRDPAIAEAACRKHCTAVIEPDLKRFDKSM